MAHATNSKRVRERHLLTDTEISQLRESFVLPAEVFADDRQPLIDLVLYLLAHARSLVAPTGIWNQGDQPKGSFDETPEVLINVIPDPDDPKHVKQYAVSVLFGHDTSFDELRLALFPSMTSSGHDRLLEFRSMNVKDKRGASRKGLHFVYQSCQQPRPPRVVEAVTTVARYVLREGESTAVSTGFA